MAQIHPLRNAELLRARAFHVRGVTLNLPARSRSGVRRDDGMVVFAMRAAAVRTADWGCVCPLWLPADRSGASATDREVGDEVLGHCRLAQRRGVAEGFVLYEDVPERGSEALALRVVRVGDGYWAKWGCTARVVLPQPRAGVMSAQLQ